MMRPTMSLRFVWRKAMPGFKEIAKVLQQQWIDTEPVETGPIQYEWRDVPCIDEAALSSDERS